MPREMRTLLVLAGLAPAAVGCYSLVPLETSATALPVGERLSFRVTDRGRAEIADRMGPGVLRVEGTLVQTDPDAYVIRVWQVSQLDGLSSRWSGEQVRLRHDLVGGVEARRLQRGRTWLTAGAAVAAFGYLVVSQELFGNVLGGGDDSPPPPPVSSRGWWQ